MRVEVVEFYIQLEKPGISGGSRFQEYAVRSLARHVLTANVTVTGIIMRPSNTRKTIMDM